MFCNALVISVANQLFLYSFNFTLQYVQMSLQDPEATQRHMLASHMDMLTVKRALSDIPFPSCKEVS